MHILFLSLEFSSQTFSGNGIAAQSQAKALASVGQNVLAVAASPTINSVTKQDPKQHNSGGSFQLIEIPVSSWGRLDSSAPWQEYQQGMNSGLVVEAVTQFRPDVAMVVDWSALPAWEQLHKTLMQHKDRVDVVGGVVPYVWLNYRVFSRTETGQGLELVSSLEGKAMAMAACTVVLSRSDQQYLIDNVQHSTSRGGNATCDGACGEGIGAAADGGPEITRLGSHVHVLLCALRGDMKDIPLPDDVKLESQGGGGRPEGGAVHGEVHNGSDAVNAVTIISPGDVATAADSLSNGFGPAAVVSSTSSAMVNGMLSVHTHNARRYITCVVRLAPEKEPQRFVSLIVVLERRGTLSRHGLTPLMVGSSFDDFAQGLKSALRSAVADSVILEQFLGPQDLAEVYAQSRLNIHPATYDAFGMTIVEAASQGCPSIVHGGNGAVGATDLLRASEGEVVLADMQQGIEHLADQVESVLDSMGRLEQVGQRAALRARSWDEATHALELIRITEAAIQRWKGTKKMAVRG